MARRRAKYVQPSPTARMPRFGAAAASRECIRHFVRLAAEDKASALARDPEADALTCSNMSLQMWEQFRTKTVHALARRALDYCRMRAHMASSGGSYAPTGWPIDRPARELWDRLNGAAS